MKKKKTPRDKVKYPALNPQYSPKVRKEFIDMDYIDQLSDQEKEWLNKFVNEYVGASLDYKNLENNLHNTKKLKKDCTDRNNARNRCMYGIAKANGLVGDDGRKENDVTVYNHNEIEDAMIDYLDSRMSENLDDGIDESGED